MVSGAVGRTKALKEAMVCYMLAGGLHGKMTPPSPSPSLLPSFLRKTNGQNKQHFHFRLFGDSSSLSSGGGFRSRGNVRARARTRPPKPDAFDLKMLSAVGDPTFGFPYSRTFCEDQFGCSAEKVVELLEPFMIEERSARLSDIIGNRIFDIVPVVEGLYDLGNIAAVSRTVEGLGIGSVHVILGENGLQGKYKQSARTTQGSHKWLQTQRWEDTRKCLTAAKEAGYKIVVTDLEGAVGLDEIDWNEKTVLLFGNEHAGVSEEAKELADQRLMIPMYGFVESFNISVAAAMALKHACDSREKSRGGKRGDLTEEQQNILQAVYYLKHIGSKSPDLIESLLAREKKASPR